MWFKKKLKIDKFSCSKQDTQAKKLLSVQLDKTVNNQLDVLNQLLTKLNSSLK